MERKTEKSRSWKNENETHFLSFFHSFIFLLFLPYDKMSCDLSSSTSQKMKERRLKKKERKKRYLKPCSAQCGLHSGVFFERSRRLSVFVFFFLLFFRFFIMHAECIHTDNTTKTIHWPCKKKDKSSSPKKKKKQASLSRLSFACTSYKPPPHSHTHLLLPSTSLFLPFSG